MFRDWFAAFQADHPGVEIEWIDKKGPTCRRSTRPSSPPARRPTCVDMQGGSARIRRPGRAARPDAVSHRASGREGPVQPGLPEDWVWEGKNWLVPFYVTKTLLF